MVALTITVNSFAFNYNLQNASGAIFIENKGQITDQYCNVRRDIDFKMKSGNAILFIGDGSLHYQFYKTEDKPDLPKSKYDITKSVDIEGYRMDVALIGANKNAEILLLERAAYFETITLQQSMAPLYIATVK